MTAELAFPRRGHIYWVRIPGEPRAKRRPALVVSPDVRNRLAHDVIVVPLSTNLRMAPTHVRLGPGEGGVTKTSVIKAEQIMTLPKERLQPRSHGGPLSSRRMAAVEKAVLRAIGVPVE